MTEYETNPHQPGKRDPGTPDETAELGPWDGSVAAGSGDAEQSEPQAAQADTPPGPWTSPLPATVPPPGPWRQHS
jgi:hypothetical protein